jgi:hypothetical protein
MSFADQGQMKIIQHNHMVVSVVCLSMNQYFSFNNKVMTIQAKFSTCTLTI